MIDTCNQLQLAEKQKLWLMGRLLFERYGIVNTPPNTLTENRWIKKRSSSVLYSSAAYQYLEKWFKWQGADLAANNRFSERREISFELPYEIAVQKLILEGSLIKLFIPFIDRLQWGELIGCITAANFNLSMGRERVKNYCTG